MLDRIPGSRVVPLGLALGVLASSLVGVGAAYAVADPPDTLPVSEVKPGMKGYGLTVFSGLMPERFDVEIISTLKNYFPNQDLFLIRTPNHPRLESAHLVAGMSGSPIYVNGKMIGAYSYGPSFAKEPIALVTPIHNMLEDLARPIPKTIAPKGGNPLATFEGPSADKHERSARAFVGAPEAYDLAEHAAQMRSRMSSLTPASDSGIGRALTPVLMGGTSNVGMQIAQKYLAPMGLEPLQAGGGGAAPSAAESAAKYVDGGAISVQLVRGDLSMAALGTVTKVVGDKLVAFGHPMMQGGLEALPTAVAKVHWIMALTSRSHKLGEPVRPLGALVNDRQASIVVDTNVVAPVFPLHVKIDGTVGSPKTEWNMEVTSDQFMSPIYTAIAIGTVAETTAAERNDSTFRCTSKLKLGKYGTVTLVDFGAGAGSPIGPDDFIRARIARAIGSLFNNPWETVKIEGIDTEIRVSSDREVFGLRGAKALDPEIDAGAPARIQIELQRYKGPIETKIIEVPVSAEMAGRDIEIELAPGYEVERPLPAPESVAQLIANLPNQTFDPESIVASFRLRENGAAHRGKVASRLPAGAIDTLRSSNDSNAPETFVAQATTAIPLGRFLAGRDSVHIKVRPVLR
ncbi:MAG TPA: SpoIVB peptidase S55 domain-containing protein [Polyangium sp.]|nr:SpoIVB peptidase S55 domain-containing protein [Polyangium sp.]